MKVLEGYRAPFVEDGVYCDGEKVGEGLKDRLVVREKGWRGRHRAGRSPRCYSMIKFTFA
jgi:hypothetical protein